VKKDVVRKVGKKEKQFTNSFSILPSAKCVQPDCLSLLNFPMKHSIKGLLITAIKNGVLTDWFLFAPHCMRIAPPLNISSKEIDKAM
jgi:acetylornithine/succinyldiaminopimelate/putrescine aminotransferase